MNQYPVWKYILILLTVLAGILYAGPNIFGDDPSIQISANRNAVITSSLIGDIEGLLKRKKLNYTRAVQEADNIEIRFTDEETQLKARDIVQYQLGQSYTVALNLLPATPQWMRAINGKPMYLGLDLRGGVHFLLRVDMTAVVKKAAQSFRSEIAAEIRKQKIRYISVRHLPNNTILAKFRNENDRDTSRDIIKSKINDLVLKDQSGERSFDLLIKLTEQALAEKRRFAIEQNITSLRNRVNELGVAEPIIQQQGDDRIVVQLPGVQDTAKAKILLGRVATLEIKLVDENYYSSALGGPVPPGSRSYKMRRGGTIVLKNDLIYSGDNIVDAAPGFDAQQAGGAIVSITLDSRGASINQRITGENINKRMAVIYLEERTINKLDIDGRPVLDKNGVPVKIKQRIEEVITAPVIRSQLGKRFQIEGLDSVKEANDLSLLLRAGALAAPVEIVEERTIGPSLGADNVNQGMKSIFIGLAAVMVFMLVYYRVFGLIADIALTFNLILIVAVLSIFQATLTLPGIAGILLTVGMAVDANVLIFERIREELRNGNTPQASIHAGYEKAFGTIADANITTLIAAITLFNFGTGPIKGFAITLSIGIATSMFTAILVSRAMTNLSFGGRNLKGLPV